jgi:hypothetical protein
MEEAPENGKESPHVAHDNGMNECKFVLFWSDSFRINSGLCAEAVAYPEIFSGGGFNKFRGQREQGSGGGSPLVRVPPNLQMGETRILIRCLRCIFHGTGNSARLCQNFGIISGGGGGFNPPIHPPGYASVLKYVTDGDNLVQAQWCATENKYSWCYCKYCFRVESLMARKCNVNSKSTKVLMHTADCLTDRTICTCLALFHQLCVIAT